MEEENDNTKEIKELARTIDVNTEDVFLIT